MRKFSKGSRFLAMLLVLVMTLSMAPLSAFAATKGELANVDTGLSGNIDTDDTISLPIRIMDYEADGMLFEFAESNGQKSAYDFGSKYCQVTDTGGDIGISSNAGGFDTTADVTVAEKSNAFVNYVTLTYKSATSNKLWLLYFHI